MRTVSVICPACKELVPVVDKKIEVHGDCAAGGMTYLPSPRTIQSSPGAPRVEIVASKHLGQERCGNCGKDHQVMFGLAKVTIPNPSNN